MTDPWNSPGQTPPPPGDGGPPPGYGPPPPGYGPSPPGYGQPMYYSAGPGLPGRVRPTGTCILLFFVTFGIYSYVYNYQVHDEMKRHSGRGVGGGIALLLTFIAGVAMPFVTPAEVGSLYALRGWRAPVRGWTGLWAIVPAVAGYIVLLVTLIAAGTAGTTTDPYTGTTTTDATFGLTLGVAFVLFFAVALAGGIVWFVKTNGALNRYWESLG
jgi:hypothetical protein